MKAESPNSVVAPCYGPDIPPKNLAIMAEMRVQEKLSRTRAVAAGELLTARQFCRALGISEQSLNKAIQGGSLFAVDGPDGMRVFPAFFVSAGNKRCDFETVSLALNPLLGDIKWDFFESHRISLQGESPVEALMKGRLNDVLRSASGFLDR